MAVWEQLQHIQFKELDGYIVRSRLPRFEDKEPNIEHYAQLEKSRSKSNLIPILADTYGNEYSQTDKLLNLTHKFYTNLYTKNSF